MTIEQLKQYLVAIKEQALRIEGSAQTVAQLIIIAEQEAASVAAEVKDEHGAR